MAESQESTDTSYLTESVTRAFKELEMKAVVFRVEVDKLFRDGPYHLLPRRFAHYYDGIRPSSFRRMLQTVQEIVAMMPSSEQWDEAFKDFKSRAETLSAGLALQIEYLEDAKDDYLDALPITLIAIATEPLQFCYLGIQSPAGVHLTCLDLYRVSATRPKPLYHSMADPREFYFDVLRPSTRRHSELLSVYFDNPYVEPSEVGANVFDRIQKDFFLQNPVLRAQFQAKREKDSSEQDPNPGWQGSTVDVE